jgi:predicted DNA binding protein
VIQLVFRLRRDRTLTRITAAHPGARLLLWCNLQNDVVEIRGVSGFEAARIVEEFEQAEGQVRRLQGSADAPRSLVFRCPHRRVASVSRLVERHGSLLIPPIVSEGGWDRFRVFCYEEAQVPAFFAGLRAMGEFELLSKSRLDGPVVEQQFMVPAAEILGSLTAKQSEALAEALEAGYYDVPRKATLQEIAERLGRPRTTMEEHLRKAEGKVLSALAPVVALRTEPLASREKAPARAVAREKRAPSKRRTK